MQPIAIIGIGCRFPGKASDPDAFWRLLEQGKDVIGEVPPDRWDLRRFYDPDPDRPGKMHTRKGGFLSEPIDRFDPLFFGISPREAEGLDPQQRLLLEVTWEAFEDAGLQINALRGSKTAVVIGGFCMDNSLQMLSPLNRQLIDNHSATCASATLLSNRISYTFNLRGPSFTLDTACSSSLVATHWACEAIRTGQASMALAGGVNIMFRPEFPIMMSKGRFLSPHGHSKAFDRDAAGYARGEGAGIVVLKPLERAMEDNDRIYAVIRGTGVNQDGRTVGIALPNGEAQAELIREVCDRAEVDPSQIAYVEAHGTGTEAGDPAELGALDSVLSPNRDAGKPFRVGSVKSNMGHLEAAAGVAGLIKTALVLHHGKVAPNLHFNHPNPKIPFDRYKLRVPTEVEPLASNGEPALAAVNSFGYGGTNAHVVLEAAPSAAALPDSPAEEMERTFLLPLSAHSPEALSDLAGKFAFMLTRQGDTLGLPDLACNTAFRRSHLPARMGVTANTKAELLEKLRQVSGGENPRGVARGEVPDEKPQLAFVYTGMGPQWWAMGRELALAEPVFGETLRQCDEIFKGISGWSVLEAMGGSEEDSRIGETQVAQPANFILQAALTSLLKEWGIVPDAVVGHSIGEVGAAYAAGCLSLEEALAVTYHRSRLQQSVAGKGTMLAASLNEEQVADIRSRHADIDVGAFNSPNSVTLSGAAGTIHAIASELDRESIFNRVLRVEVAYHSYQMDPLLAELKSSLANLHPASPEIPIYSTVTAGSVPDALHGPAYWADNVREPVRFFQTARQMLEDGFRRFLQIGPHPVLSGSLRETFLGSEIDAHVIDTLIRKEPERECLLNHMGDLYCLGIDPKWAAFTPVKGAFIRLPGYPWQRSRYWKESERSRQYRLGLPGHPLLNERADDPNPTWQVEINRQFFPYLEDHRLENNAVFPGALYVEAGLALHRTHFPEGPCLLRNLRFSRALVIDPKRLQKLAVKMDPGNGRYSVSSCYEEEGAEWDTHATGSIVSSTADRPAQLDVDEIKARLSEELSIKEYYEVLKRRGLHYGPLFQVLKSYCTDGNEFLVEVEMNPDSEDEYASYHVYPTILDSLFQAAMHVIGGDKLYVPVSIGKIFFHGRPSVRCLGWGMIRERSINGFVECDLALLKESGEVLVAVENVYCQPIQREPDSSLPNYYYHAYWKQEDLSPGQAPAEGNPVCMVFARSNEEAQKLSGQIEEFGMIPYTVASNVEGTNGCDSPVMSSMDPESPGAFRSVVSEAGKLGRLFGVVYLWNYHSENNFDSTTADSLAEAVDFLKSLSLALEEEEPSNPVRVLIAGHPLAEVQSGNSEVDFPVHPMASFGLTLANELPLLQVKHLTVSRLQAGILASELLEPSYDNIVGYREDKRYVNRLGAATALEEEPMRIVTVSADDGVELHTGTPGKLDSVGFNMCSREKPCSHEVEIQVDSCAVNYKDLLKVLGHMPVEALENSFTGATVGFEVTGTVSDIGAEVSGIKTGSKVVAIVPGGFKTYAKTPARFVFPLPENLPEESSHILLSYLTAYYGLIRQAHLLEGERVLIHSAAGGLGLAALDLARAAGAEIYATAGSEEKRGYLRKLGLKHVYDSRNLDFAGLIRSESADGVDVVLNTLTGEALRESLELLAPYGRFVEAGKRDIVENGYLPMRALNRNITFTAIDTDRLCKEQPESAAEIFSIVLKNFEKGIYTAPPHTFFPAAEIKEAFELMARSRHIGKIAVKIRGEKVSCAATQEPGQDASLGEGAILITGGLDGFGLATARHLARKGARDIVLASRRGGDPDIAEKARKSISETGSDCRVDTVGLDVTDRHAVLELFKRYHLESRPIRNIYHSAAVLDDCYLKDLSLERCRRVLAPKVTGAQNLFQASLLYSKPSLNRLVLYSSVSSLIGNSGQGSYVVANGYLDALAQHLSTRGHPVVAVNWGAIDDYGMLTRDQQTAEMLEASGVRPLPAEKALSQADNGFMRTRSRAIADVDWNVLKETNRVVATGRRFSSLMNSSLNGANGVNEELRNELIELSEKEQHVMVTDRLLKCVSHVIKLPAGRIPVNENITKLGVDSLTAVELVLAFKKEFGILLTATDLLKYPTISDFAETILRRLALES